MTDAPRYADCPVIEVDVLVDAPPAAVWELVSDPGLPARFSQELKGARWVGGAGGPAPGHRFEGSNEHPVIGAWTSHCTVVECEPGRVFSFTVGDLDGVQPSSAWKYTLTAEGAGTRVRQSMRLGPGRSHLSTVIEAMPDREVELVAGRMRDLRQSMSDNLSGVKALAEAGAARA
ncbi:MULTISPECIES: SRPBCC family protein [Actinomadura]|uniref:SRPBCC family protein n=1 Tax=Actinomadura litoris TaxID=2678616 RepID=A0A7K1LAT1_9ACTN|nr:MULTISPECIES: SRPBCC family protein [Actinomadura]MBT2213109.1 SRPBCC family protein [Actinomadura sp. NEAU-AAG7]MUN41537.1 SRPBCC family protein [Actinomadura litoris]